MRMKQLCIMLLVMLSCVISAYADSYYLEYDGILYFKRSIGQDITVAVSRQNNNGLAGDIVIPSEFIYESKTCKVVEIMGQAFFDCKNITSITIPNSVTTIGDNAFFGCSGLSSITIPNSVTSIGEGIFMNCSGLSSIVVDSKNYSYDSRNNCNAIIETETNTLIAGCQNTIIPNGVTNIESGVFFNCTSLSSITIPNSVTTIGDNAFSGCSGLSMVKSEITTPFAVKAFSNFDATLVVPKGTRADYMSVDGWEFAFTYEEDETIYDREHTDEQGIVYSLRKADDYSSYYSVTGHSDQLNTEIVIPEDLDGCPVKAIEENVFNGCTSLLSINIPNSVTTIGARAFYGCSSLQSITIPNSLTSIGKRTFQKCSNLTSVLLGDQLTTIGEYAFDGCTSLLSITIPNSVTSLGEFAFYDCYSLISATIGTGITSLKAGTFYGCSSLNTIKIPNSVISIENAADRYYYSNNSSLIGTFGVFSGCSGLNSVKMGENVRSIGTSAFSNCSNLSSIILPDVLESIGAHAFEGDRALAFVNISGSVKTIGDCAFNMCNSLASISFEEGLTSIGEHALSECAITSINIPNSVTSIGKSAFSGSNITTAILGNGITKIEEGTFYSCYGLSSVIIQEGVTTIGRNAFTYCSSLTSVKLPNSLITMEEQVFLGCPLKSIELPNSFTIIPDNLFLYNDLQYIKLGNNVQSIGKNAFGCHEPVIEIGTSAPPKIDKEAFVKIEYLSDLNVIVPDAKAETAYRKAAVWQEMTFANQDNISEVTVDTPGDLSFELITECNMMPAKVVGLKVNGTINADDFTQMLVNMKSLLRLDLSDCDITEIPDEALKGKTQLKELILPTKLQTIGKSAFQGCPYLTGQLDLPSTVTTIGESAFVGTGYTSVKMPNSLKTIGDYAFNGLPINQRLVLPGKVTSVGSYAFAGTKINGLVIPDGVKSIGNNAFAETPIQGHVTIPDGVTTLGRGAFKNTQISTVFLPNSIETLSEGLFQGCPNLDLVYVPDNYTGLANSAFDGCGALQILRLSANLATMGQYALQSTPLEYVKIPSQVETLSTGVLKNCKSLESVSLPASLKMVEAEAFYGCTALRNMSVEATTPPTIKNRSAIRGINTDKCLISIPTSAYRAYVLAEYWGQFVQMRNDIAVETEGAGEIAFESVVEEEEEEVQARAYAPRRAASRDGRRAQLASGEESMTYANNGSSVYVPQQGKVRFYIIPAEGEEILSATLDGEDIMPYIVNGVYTATADKKNAKLVVKFSGTGQGNVVKAGDVNGDGDVDVADAVCVVNHVVGKANTTFVPEAADANSDGAIDIADAVHIVNYVVGKINALARKLEFNLPEPQ